MKWYRWLVPSLLIAIGVVACGAPAGPGAQPDETPRAAPTQTPLFQVPDEALELVETVRRELAARLDQADVNIDVIDVESTEWPTAAMGCPEPGKSYAQVETSGYAFRLRAGGETYEVHVSNDAQVVFCDGPELDVPERAREFVQTARTALAERLDQVDVSALDVIDVERKEWPTAAMGCPEPDQMYAQVVTPGYAVRFRTNGSVYEVHVSEKGQVVFCDGGEESRGMEVPTGAQPAVTAAKQHLASRVDADAENIQVVEFEAVEWSDASLGCPQPGQMYAQVVTPGYRVVLEADGQTYEYHTDRGNTAVPCEKPPAGAAEQAQRLREVRDVIELVRSDLAQSLGVDESSLSVTEAVPVSELEEPAPCPEADQLSGSGEQYQIRVQARDGGQYVYRVQGENVVRCEQQ